MASQNIQTGIEIKAAVDGLQNIGRLIQEIDAAGISTNELKQKSTELADEFSRVGNQSALIQNYRALKSSLSDVNTEITQTRQKMAALKAAMSDAGSKQQASEQLELIKGYRSLKSSLNDVNTEITQTRQKMTALKAAMTDGGTKQQTKEYAALEKELGNLNGKHRELLQALRQANTGLKEAGLSAKTLAADEKRLMQETEGAKVKMTDLRREYAAQEKQLAAANQRHRELLTSLQKANIGLKEAGLSTKTLAAAENELAAATERAKSRLATLNSEAQELKALANARIQLGIDTDEKAHREIERTKKAYQDLKDSGTLSQQELARANQLMRDKVYSLERSLKDLRPSLQDVAEEVQGIVTRAGGLALVTREAMQFETAMAGVKKVADGTPEQFDALSGSLKKMAGELGMMPDALANIAAQGGQLGIPIEKLTEFTEMAAQMSRAFDMSAEEAGDAAAKLANVFQLPMSEVSALGDAINALGNNTAAREKDIVAAMTRIGGNAKQFGLASEQAAALADAFIALGKPPEVAATAINALLGKLQTAQTQGADFQAALQSIGLSADQMAAQIAANPQQALSEFLSKLQTLDNQSRAIALTKLFGQEYSDDIALLVGSLGEYQKALDLVADKTANAGAMQKEANNTLNTAQGKIDQAKASIAAMAATLGETLLPMISGVASGVGKMADNIRNLAEAYPALTQLVAIIASVRLSIQAFNTVTRLTGGIVSSSFLQAEVASTGLRKKLLETKVAASLLNSELAKTGKQTFNETKAGLGVISKRLLNVANQATMAFGAFEVGNAVGAGLYESFDWVKSVGDQFGKLVAYADALVTDRTFEDVRQYYKTSSQAAEEMRINEARLAEERKQQEAQRQEQYLAERQRLQNLREQHQSLAEQQAGSRRSLELLAEQGITSGHIFDALQANIADTAQKMADLRTQMGEAGKAMGELAGDDAKAALEALGLTASQVATGIHDDSKKLVDSFATAAQAYAGNAEGIGRLFEAALSKMNSPQEIELLKQRLREVGEEAGLTAKEIEAIADKAPETADKVAAAFEKIGVNVREVTDGVGKEAAQAFKDFQAASNAAAEAGNEDARLIRAGFEQVFAKLKSKQEFAEFRQQLKDNQQTAKLTAEQLKRLNDAAEQGAASARTAYESLGDSMKKAASAADLSQVASAAKSAMESGTISAAQYDKVLGDIKQRTDELNASTAKIGTTAAASHERAAQAARHTAQAAVNFNDASEKSADAAEKTERAANKTADASDKTARAAKSTADSAAAAGESAQLSAQGARAAAEASERALAAAAERRGLEGELARLQGNDDQAASLEQEQKLLELRQKMTEAQAAGDARAVAEYQRSLSLQRQIFAEKQRQSAEERAAAEAQQKAEAEQPPRDQTPAVGAAPTVNIAAPELSSGTVSDYAQQIAGSINEALSERDKRLIERVLQELMNRLQDEFKRMN